MKLFVLNEEEMNLIIATQIIELVKNKPNCILGLATGSSPIGVYKKIAILSREKHVSFKNVKTFNLDEYVGLKEDNKNSYRYFMNDNLFFHIDIDINNTHVPSGINYEHSISNYDNEIKKEGGIDLQILGIGSNGHIAFNEPGTSFDSLTHVVNLKESTIIDNARFFNNINEVPRRAITMGLKSIMRAKKIILIAKGKNKAEAIYKLFNEEKNINMPASILKDHSNVEIYCDEEASIFLRK